MPPSFTGSFVEAIRWARKRVPVLPEVYYGELAAQMRSRAFTVSGLAAIDQIQRVRDSLARAIDEGESFGKWKKSVDDDLFSLPDWHKELVFRANVQTAYNAGHWEGQQEVRQARPFLMYDAINDSRTRPSHRKLDGYIAPIDDPVWNRIYPPNGFNCRCSTIQLSEAQARARGWKGETPPVPAEPDPGWGHHPAKQDDGLKEAIAKRIERCAQSLSRLLASPGKCHEVVKRYLESLARNMESTSTALPLRTPWGRQAGGAEILAKEHGVKSSLYYPGAKTGGTSAAVQLVFEQVPEHKIRRALMKYRDDDPIIAPVHGIEAVSDNVIPLALAVYVSEVTGFELDRGDLVQTNRAGHTGASGWHRIANPALFSGEVKNGRRYILIDDFLGMGGTFANMKGYIESKGGTVIAMMALTGKPRSRQVALRPETLKKLRDQYGTDFETWWETVSGADFSHLTEAEALYLVRAKHADAIRDRIAAAKEDAGDR